MPFDTGPAIALALLFGRKLPGADEDENVLPSNLRGTAPHHKMQDQGNHRENQKQVNQSAGNMKDGEAAKPCDQ